MEMARSTATAATATIKAKAAKPLKSWGFYRFLRRTVNIMNMVYDSAIKVTQKEIISTLVSWFLGFSVPDLSIFLLKSRWLSFTKSIPVEESRSRQ